MQDKSGRPAGTAGCLRRRQRGLPGIGVEAVAVDGVGLARHDIEQRGNHLVRLDQTRGAAFPGVLAPAPGLTMLIVTPVPAVSLAQTSVAISSAAFEAP